MESNFTNLLRLPGNVPPPCWIGKVDVRQRPLVEGDSTIISIAFMLSPIYLRLEDNVPPFFALEKL